jgi:hypothetical protein
MSAKLDEAGSLKAMAFSLRTMFKVSSHPILWGLLIRSEMPSNDVQLKIDGRSKNLNLSFPFFPDIDSSLPHITLSMASGQV